MTAGERLRSLAGIGGTAATLLLLIGSGPTAGAALVNYSALPSTTAAAHLLADHAPAVDVPASSRGGKQDGYPKRSLGDMAMRIASVSADRPGQDSPTRLDETSVARTSTETASRTGASGGTRSNTQTGRR